MTQLKHQRKANKHIMEKMKALEHKIGVRENGEIILRPSQTLMEGYSEANVDQVDDDDLDEKLSSAFTRTDSEDVSERSAVNTPIPNPPDIIAGEVSLQRSASSDDEIFNKSNPEKTGRDLEGVEETITLPDHLQFLVDQAMQSLKEEEDHDSDSY
jgi:hypothetical protein